MQISLAKHWDIFRHKSRPSNQRARIFVTALATNQINAYLVAAVPQTLLPADVVDLIPANFVIVNGTPSVVLPYLSINENLALALKTPNANSQHQLDAVIAKFNLASFFAKQTTSLSAFELGVLSLLKAIASDATVIVVNDFLNHLSVAKRRLFLEILTYLVQNYAQKIVLITSNAHLQAINYL